MSVYTVRGIKTFKGMEGEGYNATLCRDGKPVALAVDDASGGPLQIDWKDRDTGKSSRVEVAGYEGKKYLVSMTPEERLLHEHATSLPDLTSGILEKGRPIVMKMTLNLYVEELVNDALLLKDVRRMIKGKVAYIDGGKLFTARVTAANEARVLEDVKRQHPDAMVLNGRQDYELLAALKTLPR